MIMRVKVATSLLIRSKPSLCAEPIDILPNNTMVNVIEHQDDWCRIDSYGLKYDKEYIFSPCPQESWVYAKYLRKHWWFRFLKYNK